jgi:hypothetical protein
MARQMGQSGRRCVEDHFEIGKTTRLVMDLYRGIMEDRV